jgi:DNA invertase Pin-like site-specific DNA recombinase
MPVSDTRHAGSLRAALYVRMSTDKQQYSTENQALALLSYAEKNKLEVVRTYTDSGKSGLDINGRDALQQLIADVALGQKEFDVILVYDVTRWGRFQDADESAYYEHLCKRAGVHVLYCAEQFENDGSMSSTLIKSLKRFMSGAYSQDLSKKVFAGASRLIELGFRQGGASGPGLRRLLVDQDRNAKAELRCGERKSLQTDRVVLVPGPPDEVEAVRDIFRLFTEERLSESQIARMLCSRNTQNALGTKWSRALVHGILTNEKYIGNNVYNRTSRKLKSPRIRNPTDEWVRRSDAFEPIIDRHSFLMAQEIIASRARHLSDDELLERLQCLLAETGFLSALIIDEREDLPSSAVYARRFGGLHRAYSLIGYSTARDLRYIETNRFLRRLYPEIIAWIVEGLRSHGADVEVGSKTDMLLVNGEFTVAVSIARCSICSAGVARWKARLDTGLGPDLTVIVRMQHENCEVRDYYLLPARVMPFCLVSLHEENGLLLEALRLDDLEPLFALAERRTWRRVA